MKQITTYINEKANFIVKKHVNPKADEARRKAKKWEFSDEDMDEIIDYIVDDEDFQWVYNDKHSSRFNSYNDAVNEFYDFLTIDVYADGNKDVHKFYMLSKLGEGGYSSMRLGSGKIVNLDNLYTEFKSIVQND